MKKKCLGIGHVHLKKTQSPPIDHVGRSRYMKQYLGELVRPDGTYYSRLERRAYYSREERSHPAKTPLHIARWSVQEFTRPGDWVLDPMAGVGTSLVEALRLGRNAFGMELEFVKIARKNVGANNPLGMKFDVVDGDARKISQHLGRKSFALIVNNPPYSGDLRQTKFAKKGERDTSIFYEDSKNNLAFLKESKEYWDVLESIYVQCIKRLSPKGHFVIGVKDMMRNKKPFLLHEKIGDLLSRHLKYVGLVLLKHYPGTMFLNTYEKMYGIKPPSYQTILVFRGRG